MEALRIRRALELQDAYEIRARGQWHAYLVAKERLVLARAED